MLAVASLADAGSMIDEFEDLTVREMCELMPLGVSILRPNTCNYWVRCPGNGTSLEEGACAVGLNYDKNEGKCNVDSSVACPYTESIKSNVCANQTDGTFLADPTNNNCTGYILCKGGREVKSTCPNDLLFKPQSSSCVYPNQYTCPKIPNKTTSPVCRSLPHNTRLADDKYCNKYYACVNDKLHEYECDAQMAYDVALGRCVPVANVTCYGKAALPPPENTFCKYANGTARSGYFADPESCSHYYICAKTVNGTHDKNPQHLQCSQGLFFDYEKLSCRDRLNVRCTLDRCAGSSLTYVNVLGNCQRYARCASGVAVGYGTCPPEYYFDERNQGCTPVNHNYIACAA